MADNSQALPKVAKGRAGVSRPPLVTRIRRVLRQEGLAGLCAAVAERVWRRRTAIWHERDLTVDLATAQARIPISIILDDPRGTIQWLRTRPHDPSELSLALANGHLLARAELDQTPIGYVKAGWGKVWVSDYQSCISFPDEAAFIYDSYVDPAHRGRRVGSALVGEVMRELKARAFSRVFCHIPERNVASRRLYESSGFVPRRRICFTRLLGATFLLPHPRVLWRRSAASATPARRLRGTREGR